MFTAKKLFPFFDYFVTAHAIITKIISLVHLIGKIILISKKYIFYDFCGRLDQIRLQKMVRTACYPYTETMLYKGHSMSVQCYEFFSSRNTFSVTHSDTAS